MRKILKLFRDEFPGHTPIKLAHPLDFGTLCRSSEFLGNVASSAALPLDHATMTHRHSARETISHESIIVGLFGVERLNLNQRAKLGSAIAASIDVAGRTDAHGVAANRAAKCNAIG